VCVKDEDNEELLRSEGSKHGNEGHILFQQSELNAQANKKRPSGDIRDAISSISQSAIADCSSALCMSAYIDFWRETDSRGLLPWNKPDCVVVSGGVAALSSPRPIGISGGVQPSVKCTLAAYLQRKSPPSTGASLLLLHRVMLMLKALHASSLIAIALCSSAIVCERPFHPDEYYEGAMKSELFTDTKEKQR
jgi:hypothetical protein